MTEQEPEEIEIPIYWSDLRAEIREDIAKQLGKTAEQFEKEGNYDVFPLFELIGVK